MLTFPPNAIYVDIYIQEDKQNLARKAAFSPAGFNINQNFFQFY